MFIAFSAQDSPEITHIGIDPQDTEGRPYSVELTFNIGNGEQKLMPAVKDLLTPICPFINLDKFKPEFLRFISVSSSGIALCYKDTSNPDLDANSSTVDLFVSTDDFCRLIGKGKFSIGIYFYRVADEDCPSQGIKKGDSALFEAYDFDYSLDDSDAIFVNIATKDFEGEYCIVNEEVLYEDNVDDSDDV